MSHVAKNSVVTFHYTLTDDAGTVLDSSRGAEPMTYLHGHDGIVPGLERELDGKGVGDKLVVKVAAKDGYGERSGPGPRAVPKASFPGDVDLEVGMQFFAPGPKGRPQPVWVTEVSATEVKIDTNHPLAGVNLNFDVEITALRVATKEELSHGHVHGPDGHHHH